MFRLFGRRKSKENVKERLKLVLSYDRAKLTPGKMQELKTELLAVIGKYFPSEDQEYDVRFEQQGERMVLMANLPMAATTDGAGPIPDSDPAAEPKAKPAAGGGNKSGNKSGGKSGQGRSKSRRK